MTFTNLDKGTYDSLHEVRSKVIKGSKLKLRFRPGEPTVVELPIDEALIWPWVRQQILERPAYVAQQTGIEQIAYLKDILPPQDSPKLEAIGKLYVAKPGL